MSPFPLMRVPASYLLSLADILLRRAGTGDADGLAYGDARCEIRGSDDLSTVTVLMKAHGTEISDKVVATRSPEGDAIYPRHVQLAAHVEERVAHLFGGERVFRFLVEDSDGTRSAADVHAVDLSDAKHALIGDGGPRLLALLAAPTPAEFGTGGSGGAPIATPRILRAAAHAARVEEAGRLPDEVYLFSARDMASGNGGTYAPSRPVRALSLADAESGFREQRPEPSVRIDRIEIVTLLDWVQGKGRDAWPPSRSPGIVARDGAEEPR